MDEFDKQQSEALARIRGDNEPSGVREKAYSEGVEAFLDVRGSASNPYDPIKQTYIFQAWHDGYESMEKENDILIEEQCEIYDSERGII